MKDITFFRILLLLFVAGFFLLSTERVFGQEAPLFEWAKSFGGTIGDQALHMKVDASGNVYMSGHFGSTVDFDPGPGNTSYTSTGGLDIFITKFDTNGNLIWARTLGGSSADEVFAIEVDNTGNVYATGYFSVTADFDPGAGIFNLTSAGSADIFISKLNTNGDFVWAKSIGGAEYEQAFDIAVDNSGNVFTTGSFWNSTVDFDPGAGTVSLTPTGGTGEDVFVLKLDNNGNYVWVKKFGGTESERGHTIAIDGSGNVLTTGGFVSYTAPFDFDPGPSTFILTPAVTPTQWDIYICKLDNTTGDITWAKEIAGTLWDIDQSLTIDNSDNLLLTGYFQATTDFDPGPGTSVLTSNGSYDPFIVKLNSAGDFVWAKSMTGTADDRGDGITTDAAGNVYTSGSFQGTVDFDPGAGTFNMTSVGQSDIYMSKLDVNGNLVWAYRMGSSGFDFGLSIALDNLGKIFTTGSFSSTIDADPGSCTFNLTSNGSYDIFLQKITTGIAPPAPTITSFSPTSGPVGTSVSITGTNFSTTPANNTVAFNGTAATVTASTTTGITTMVPTGATTGKISVTTNCNTVISTGNFTIGATLPPTITSFTPASGPIGTTVTITGTNFNTTPANNIVFFGATQTTVTAATTTQLTVAVPTGATYEPIVVMNNGLMAYSSKPFIVTFAGESITTNSFGAHTDFVTNEDPTAIAVGDWDGDGKVDMAVTNIIPATGAILSIYRNTSTAPGNTNFVKLDFNLGPLPAISIVTGDFDGDGKPDLATANWSSAGTISFFRNTSAGAGNINFATRIDLPAAFYPASLCIGDLDRDGKTDVAVTNVGNSTGSTGNVFVYRNTSTGPGNISFATKIDFVTGGFPESIAMSDLDGDGKVDLATTKRTTGGFVMRNTSTGPGNINFAGLVNFTTGSAPYAISIGDVDSDGKAEIVTPNRSGNTISVLRNTSTGPGNISYAANVDFATEENPIYAFASDLDGDGRIDFATANQAETISVLRNTSTSGSISFDSKVDYATGDNAQEVSIVDVDGDGKPEIVTVNREDNTISVLRKLNLSFPTITSFTPASGPIGATVTITGTNFSATPANNTVNFNGTPAIVSASSSTSITTTVPAGANTGLITVMVGSNTATSATNFTITTAPAITITFTTQPTNRTTCESTNTTFSLAATGDTNLQYKWQIDNAGFTDLTNSTVYSGVNTATLTISNPALALNGKIYRCVVRGDNSTDTPSASATLTVNGVPTAPIIGTSDLGCAPAGTTLTPDGAAANESYYYYAAAVDGNSTGSGISFTTPSLSASTTYYVSIYHTTTLCESTRTPALVIVQTCNAPIVIAATSAAYLEGIVTVDLGPLVSDPDDNLDISTLKIVSPPASGAMATLNGLILTVDYITLPFPGTDDLTIEICDLTEICTQQKLTIETAGDISVYNAVSPNDDGKNDAFILQYVDAFADTQKNKVTIFNRWGDVISEIENYNNKERVFKGLNKSGNEVPSGTYFYKIEYASGRTAKMGYLVLKR